MEWNFISLIIPYFFYSGTCSVLQIEKVKDVQRNLATEGKKGTRKGGKREMIQKKTKEEQSSSVMRMEDFFEPVCLLFA